MRISGLATGMDTETIIRDMMKAHRMPLDKITQKKQYLQWQLDDYRSINRNLRDYSHNVADNMLRSHTFFAKTVTISNPNAVSIKSTSATSEFAGTLEVHALAKQASLQSGVLNGAPGEKAKLSTKLEDLEGWNGERIIKIQSIEKDGSLSGVKELRFNGSDTLDTVMKRINSEAGVSAFYDEFTGKIALTAKNSGSLDGGEIVIGGQLGNVLNLTSDKGATYNPGQNADFTFNGLRTERSTNSFQINGFEITLKEVTTGEVSFSSAPDTDSVFDSVKKFVDDYNKLIDELNAKIREPKYRDFQPLSDEQKKDMKEKEIELWDEKAMSGTLRNDPTITSMLQSMRNALNGMVEGTDGPIRLSDIGITTGPYQDRGKLVIDETKLREAITENPNKVYEVFGKTGTGDNQGLAGRLKKAVDDGQSKIAARAGSVGAVNDTFILGRTMKDMDKQIERFEDRLKMVEDRYWKQFTAMERAIQRSNAQSAYLMNAFGGGM